MAIASIILLETKERKDDTHPVVLRITHDYKRRYFVIGENSKGWNCKTEEWNKRSGRFKSSFKDGKKRNNILAELEKKANGILLKFEENNEDFTFSKFEQEFRRFKPKDNLKEIFEEEIDRLVTAGRIGYSKAYYSTLKAIMKFHGNESLKLRDIDNKFLTDFEAHIRGGGAKKNTVYMYMRTLRTLFNSAIKYGYIKEEHYPFFSRTNPNGYSLRGLKEKTLARPITKEQMFMIRDLELPEGFTIYHDRNMLMFSYYCRGMNFRDMALLRWTNIQGGRLRYTRAKTGGKLDIELLEPTKKILRYYKKQSTSPFVFPILKEEIDDPEKLYNRATNASHRFNRNMKKIAKMLELPPITSYVARDTYAKVMRNKPIGIVSHSMDHKSIKQTEEYFERFPDEEIDEANKDIL